MVTSTSHSIEYSSGTEYGQEDQLQAHKPKIIPRPGRREDEQPAVSGASGQVASVVATHR
jgi:hypothetical protein